MNPEGSPCIVMGRLSGARTIHGNLRWEFYCGAVGQTGPNSGWGALRDCRLRFPIRWAYRSAAEGEPLPNHG